jgi:hypothetical protein
MDRANTQLFQRVRLTCDQANSAGQQGWTGTIMDYQEGDDHAQVEIDARYASQTFLGIALADLEPLSLEPSQ